jgi:ATP-dependent helicase/nuclease subunit B
VSSTGTEPALANGAAILVAGGLAARQWELHLSAAAIAAGRRAWVAPPIVTYGSWLERLWQSAAEQRALPLGPAQAFALWRRIVAESKEGAGLLGDRGAARWAADAFALCCDWNVDLDREPAGAPQSDFRAFLGWRRRYLAALRDNGWIDRAQIPGLLARGDPLPPQRLILADLDEPTPAQRSLFARLERDGWQIECESAPVSSAARLRVRLADARDELRTAVAWARRRIASSPSCRVALVVPALDERRAELERALEQPLAHRAAREDPTVPLWYGGRALAESPRVGAALDALSLGTESATFETLSRWLRSPFFGDASELATRAGLERELRRDVLAQLPFSVAYRETDLSGCLRRAAPQAAASLGAALRETRDIERATPSGWALAWQRTLANLQWSGASDPEDSLRWQAAVDDFSRLTPILGQIGQGAALVELRRALEPPAPVPLPVRGIHVVERMADVGPGYDAVWLTGFTDQAWPETARGNPLLPRALQRKHEMPSSTPQDARARSARALDRLSRRVTTLVASWPARVYDFEAEPSPALRHWRDLDAAEIAVERPRAARRRETVIDRAPAIGGAQLHGGAGVLNRQARCPLRAFCEYRLDARPLERVGIGMNGRLRGMATHRALELLLADLPSREHFAAKLAEIRAVAQRALGEVFRDARAPLRALFELEAARLETALARFVALEQSRAPFRVVAVERKTPLEVAGFELRVRVDRIDELGDGTFAILDYKTGELVTSKDWFRDRPRDVQVPLYAAHAAQRVSAAALAAVTAEPKYRGYWHDDAFLGRPARLSEYDWAAQLARWRTQIEALVREHAAGDTRVFVADSEEAEGAYAPLTRVDEQLAIARGSLEPW